MKNERKKVFISYSWDSIEHQEWVLEFANNLIQYYGIDIILDQYELSAGRDLLYFMEQSIFRADKVLLILTPGYKLAAENRTKGVGYESLIIAQEIYESPITNSKFIPIIRSGNQQNAIPRFLKSKIYVELTDDRIYTSKLQEVSKAIYDTPPTQKPEFGPLPGESTLGINPLMKMAQKSLSEVERNMELTKIVESYEGVEIFNREIEVLKSTIRDTVNLYSSDIGFILTHEIYQDKGCISDGKYSVFFKSERKFENSAAMAFIEIKFFTGRLKLHSSMTSYSINPYKASIRLNFDLDFNHTAMWRSDNEKYSTNEVVNLMFAFIVERLIEDNKKLIR